MHKDGIPYILALLVSLCFLFAAAVLQGCADDDDDNDSDDDGADDDDDGDDDNDDAPPLPEDHSPDADCYNCHIDAHGNRYVSPGQCLECHGHK